MFQLEIHSPLERARILNSVAELVIPLDMLPKAKRFTLSSNISLEFGELEDPDEIVFEEDFDVLVERVFFLVIGDLLD